MNRAIAAYARPDADREILARHGHLVERCARRLAARSAGAVAAEDLWSVGAMGLLDAARRFDPARDVRFETFAEHRVRGAMVDEMRRMDRLPRRLRSDADRVEAARATLARTLGRDPGPDEIAESIGEEPEAVAEILMLLEPVVPVHDELPWASEGADEEVARRQTRTRLAQAIAELPERLRILLALYYDEELTYREIARLLQVSEPRVCQLHADAVKRLRAAMAS